MNKRKLIVKTVAVVLALTPFLALTSNANAASPITLTFWSRPQGENGGIVKQLADAYNATHTDIQLKITIIPANDFVTKVATAYQSGEGPDLTSVDLIYVPFLASAGALEDLSSLVAGLSYKDKWDPAHVKLSMYNKKWYSLPFTGDASALFYNKDLFKKAGLDPNKGPASYQEVIDAAKKITALGGGNKGFYFSGACAGCQVFTFAPAIWASGGDMFGPIGEPKFNDPNVAAGLRYYNTMWKNGYVPEGAKTDDGKNFASMFYSGKVGMQVSGSFMIPELTTNHKDINFGIVPIPGPKKGQSSSFNGGDNIALLKGAAHPAEAREFLKWATNEGQKVLAQQKVLPTRMDIAKSDYVPQNPYYGVFYKAAEVGVAPWSTVYPAMVNDANGPWSRLITTTIFSGEIAKGVAAAQKTAEKIYKTAKK